MSAEYVWAPGVVGSLLSDPEMAAVLGIPLPRPCHDHGTTVDGCATFPADWTAELIAARARETAADNSWRRIRRTYAFYKQYGDTWLYVLQREARDGERRSVATYPWPHGPGVTRRRRNRDFIAECASAICDALEAEPGDWVETFSRVGDGMYGAGQVAESLMWMIESSHAFDLKLPENIYLNLYVMALKGLLSGTRDQHPEEIIAAAWADAYPSTWGLPPAMMCDTWELEVPCASVPSPREVAACASRWLSVMLPRTGLTRTQRSRMIDGVFKHETGSIAASFGSDAAAQLDCLRQPQPDDDVPEPFDRWEVTLPGNPRSHIAGLALLLASAELGQCNADYMDPPERSPDLRSARAVLRKYADFDALQRLVLVERAPNVTVEN